MSSALISLLCRYALVPVYLYGGFCILHSIRRTSAVFQLAYPVLVAACLAPQLLLEFRYFILPFLFYRLQGGGIQFSQPFSLYLKPG